MLFNLFGCGSSNTANNGKTRNRGESGTCGDGVSWTYDKSSKTLTISGSGEMVTSEKFMWSDYKIDKLVISEGITTVAAHAFYSNHY